MGTRNSGALLNWLLVIAIAISGAAAVITVVINTSANKAISTEAERSLLIADMQAAVQVESEQAAEFVAHLPGMGSDPVDVGSDEMDMGSDQMDSDDHMHEGGHESVHAEDEESTALGDHPEVRKASSSFDAAAERLLNLAGSPAGAEDVKVATSAHDAFVASLGRLNDEVHADGDGMALYHNDTQISQAALTSSIQRLRNSVNTRLTEAVERSDWSHTLLVATLPISALGALVAAVWLTRTRKARLQVEVLEHVISEKDKFIGAVSHEIRTPMAGILGFAELLADGEARLTEAEKREYLSLILSQGNEVSAIVDDLLVAARAEIGDLSVVEVPVNLTAQARQVVETLEFADAKPLVPEETVHGLGDPARVRQIIRNLLTNAVRYGGPRIKIEISSDEHFSTIQVSDNGQPIPPEERDRIFEAYTTLTEARPVTGSIGLGLTVARQLALLMGGQLVYERIAGENVFALTIPSGLAESPGSAKSGRHLAAAARGAYGQAATGG